MKILLIEDEKLLAQSVTDYLTKEGYICEVASDYIGGDEKAQVNLYDCILLDITLPGGSGMDILRQIKQTRPDASVIIISAKNSLDDKISGLDIGADDYITKPFHLSELNARVKSVIRRKNFAGSNEIIFEKLIVNTTEKSVRVNKKDVVLTKKEYDLLLYFLSNIDRVVTKESIAEHLWGEEIGSAGSLDFIYSHIKNLRKKLMENGTEDYIQAIYGMGYKFCKS
jgi:DNA-binding response OmpR family regulator